MHTHNTSFPQMTQGKIPKWLSDFINMYIWKNGWKIHEIITSPEIHPYKKKLENWSKKVSERKEWLKKYETELFLYPDALLIYGNVLALEPLPWYYKTHEIDETLWKNGRFSQLPDWQKICEWFAADFSEDENIQRDRFGFLTAKNENTLYSFFSEIFWIRLDGYQHNEELKNKGSLRIFVWKDHLLELSTGKTVRYWYRGWYWDGYSLWPCLNQEKRKKR